jgi:Flp pilus assembly protein TadG
MPLASRTNELTSRFWRDRGGNFGIMTALILVPLLLGAGMALDFNSAVSERTRIQDVADSAALAGAGVYNGTNAAAAIANAERFLKGYRGQMLDGATFHVAMNGQSLEVTISGTTDNAFMGIAGLDTTDISVVSEAIAPTKPKTIVFTPTKSQGYYYKKVSIIVVRPNSTAEQVVGTVTYQPTTHDNSGQGTMVVSPSNTIDLGKYSQLILQMEIKNDGCGTGEAAIVSGAQSVA